MPAQVPRDGFPTGWSRWQRPAGGQGATAIYAQHCDIYLAPTWDSSDTWVATLRHIAKEGGQFVIGVAPLLRGSGVPEVLRGTVYGLEDDWMSRGHTTIIAP